jgi:hypothetical protein
MKLPLILALTLMPAAAACQKAEPARGSGMDSDPNAQALRNARSEEPRSLLPKIAENARVYTMEARVAQGGAELPRGFPAGDAGPTPPLGSCCQAATGLCAPDPAQWQGVWGQLSFAINAPSPYSYSYHSDGHTFTASASGDLDCDGVYSTFTIQGKMVGDEPSVGGLSFDQELE